MRIGEWGDDIDDILSYILNMIRKNYLAGLVDTIVYFNQGSVMIGHKPLKFKPLYLF